MPTFFVAGIRATDAAWHDAVCPAPPESLGSAAVVKATAPRQQQQHPVLKSLGLHNDVRRPIYEAAAHHDVGEGRNTVSP